MDFWSQLLTIAFVHFIAVVSPGPDFILITRNSLVYSRKTGILTALGLGTGILIHVIYSLLGIGLIISKSVLLFTTIKFIGAAYLFYIGYKSITSKHSEIKTEEKEKKEDLKPIEAFKMGFLTNVTNPKVTLFFLALFTQIIRPETPIAHQIVFGAEMAIATFLWFAFVALCFSYSIVKKVFSKVSVYIEKLMGGILILFGIKLALSSK